MPRRAKAVQYFIRCGRTRTTIYGCGAVGALYRFLARQSRRALAIATGELWLSRRSFDDPLAIRVDPSLLLDEVTSGHYEFHEPLPVLTEPSVPVAPVTSAAAATQQLREADRLSRQRQKEADKLARRLARARDVAKTREAELTSEVFSEDNPYEINVLSGGIWTAPRDPAQIAENDRVLMERLRAVRQARNDHGADPIPVDAPYVFGPALFDTGQRMIRLPFTSFAQNGYAALNRR